MTPDIRQQPPQRQPVTGPSNPTLLGLPPHVRHRIYLHLGVARCDGLPFTYYLDGYSFKESRRRRRNPSPHDPPPTRTFAGLLLSCRALYAEATALLYSANQFIIFYSGQASLGPLRALSTTALASLTSLKVVLNESSCHPPTEALHYPPPCCCDDLGDAPRVTSCSYHCSKHHGSRHRRPLLDSALSDAESVSATEATTRALLAEWHDTAVSLASNVGAGRMTLSLVCDIDHRSEFAVDAARLAVAPLALFPPLRDCHVRLGKEWSYPLQQLAEDAVLQLETRPSASHLRLASAKARQALVSLPRELRFRILEYTDLITPWGEVSWCRQSRRFQVCRPPCFQPTGGCPPHIHHGCRLSQCDIGSDDPSRFMLSPGCFCRRRHAAFSFICRCWEPPTGLFLVCRVLCRDAQFVFFSGNRFIVHDLYATPCSTIPPVQHEPWTPDTPSADKYYPYERLAASYFLRNAVPSHCLPDLRFLELVFPPYVAHGWPLGQHPAMADWRATVDWMRREINAPALTIRVVFPDFLYGLSVGRRDISHDQGMWILKGYKRIIHPLHRLVTDGGGLAALYVQATYPWRWTKGVFRIMELDGNQDWVVKTEQHLKEHLELIPGWGPGGRGKPEPRESAWQRWYDVPQS